MPIRKVSAILLRVPSPPHGARADSHEVASDRSGKAKAEAAGLRVPLARCAAVIPPPPLPVGRSSWQGGSFAPRCIPRTMGFARWTRPEALRLLDFRPGGPSCPPWTSRPGETSLSPWTLIDHGPCPVDPRRMRSAPAPLTNPARIGCAPCRGLITRRTVGRNKT